MAELSQALKNFLTQFEHQVLPHINMGKVRDGFSGFQPITCYVSSETLRDPQVQELLGITKGQRNGRFLGVSVVGKPDMSVELHYKKERED